MNKINRYIVVLLMIVVGLRIIYLYYYKHDKYYMDYLNKTNTIIYGFDAPRGRILDRNGKVLVDNKGINNVVYRKLSNNELDIAKKISEIVYLEEGININKIKDYYILTNDTDDLISDEEWDLYRNRKIDNNDLYNMKLNRITDDMIDYDEKELNVIKIYNKMISNYSYENKVIKNNNVTDSECALIEEANLPGVSCQISWERVYNYGDTLKGLFGKIGPIPNEELDYYLDLGYERNDLVGISYLEKEYESTLRGIKDSYKVNGDNTLSLVNEGSRGNDLYLSIDIDLQNSINDIIKEELIKAKKLRNTDLLDRNYTLVGNPNDGSIIAITGISYLNDEFYDVTTDVVNSSFIVGSVIKGASMTVGYLNDVIDVGKKINDACVKLYMVPEKCSYKRWGYIDDVTALKTSSNYYQFITAIKTTGNVYKRNMKLSVGIEDFNRYRDVFKKFGLGNYTGIDLPNESLGITGKTIAPDLLLNLSIGQYDTYTPVQLLQYINTVSMDGVRMKLTLMNKIVDNNDKEFFYNKDVLSVIEDNRFDRIKKGMQEVVYGGTGNGYVDKKYNAAGKTGTSEVVYSRDINTINQTFASFAPVDNPKYSIVTVTPNAAITNRKDDYVAPVNYRISKRITKLVYDKI